LNAGCSDFSTDRTVDSFNSFGEVVYREGCQRVAYTGQLAQRDAGKIATVDVSGGLGHSVCVDGNPAPADSPEKLKAIQQQKSILVTTVDAILPRPFLDDLEGFLEAILPLADDGTMDTAITSLAGLLGQMAQDADFPTALARLANRIAYRPTKTAVGLMHAIVEYPQIDDFLGKTLGLIAPGGTAEVEWKTVLTALSQELKMAAPVKNPADSERTLKLALDLMMTTHPDLGSGTPRPLVQRDYRGLAVVALVNGKVPAPFVDANGDGLADDDAMGHYVGADGMPLTVATPFPDSGANDTAPRDTQGRALSAQNAVTTLYNYFDLDGTVLGGMTRETLTLMNPAKDTTLGLVHGLSALLGPRATQVKMYLDDMGAMMGSLSYSGFDTTQSAVLDMLHAFIQILGDPVADKTLETTSTLLTQHESETTRLIKAMLDTKDLGNMHPEAAMPEQSTIYDELMPLIARVLHVPGLAQDLLIALEDPHAKGFAPMVARLMNVNDQMDFDHVAGPNYPLYGNLDNATPVNRNMPDVDYNRSLMQRIAHLIHDTNGLLYCNKQGANPLGGILGTFNQCDMFKIDDLALFYILNMASKDGNGVPTSPNPSAVSGADFCGHVIPASISGLCPTVIENQTGITGFTQYPTPRALNRALFLRQNEKSAFMSSSTDDAICHDGDKYIDVHDKSLFAWEVTLQQNPSGFANDTFYDAVRPIIDAFAKHDECDAAGNCHNAAKIFIDIFAMLHEHWSSPKGSYFGFTYQSTDPSMPRYGHDDSLVSYEPLLNIVLGTGDIIPSIIDLAPVLNSVNTDGTPAGGTGVLIADQLVSSARYLFVPGASPTPLAYRDGMTSTVWSDGKTPVPVTTPYYLMADAFAHKRAALVAADATQKNAWRAATGALIDQMLTVDQLMDGSYQMRNRRMHAVTLVLVDFIRSRMAKHTLDGDLDTWIGKTLTGDLTDTLGGPVFASLADFVSKIEADPDARTQLYGLLSYLVDEASNDLTFQTALTTLADQVQTFLDDPNLVPVARMLGVATDPDTGPVHAQLTLVKKARDVDAKKALLTILRNLYRPESSGVYPASDLADTLSEINRAQPGIGGPLAAVDYKTILQEVADFLTDQQRGYERFLAIVKTRGPNQ
jgi:hypothetical protein